MKIRKSPGTNKLGQTTAMVVILCSCRSTAILNLAHTPGYPFSTCLEKMTQNPCGNWIDDTTVIRQIQISRILCAPNPTRGRAFVQHKAISSKRYFSFYDFLTIVLVFLIVESRWLGTSRWKTSSCQREFMESFPKKNGALNWSGKENVLLLLPKTGSLHFYFQKRLQMFS